VLYWDVFEARMKANGSNGHRVPGAEPPQHLDDNEPL
jgi:hypothetical protein